jgi:transposase
LAKRAGDADQARRLLSLAAVLDGMSRKAAAEIGAMDRHTLRDWAHRFNAKGPAGLINVDLDEVSIGRTLKELGFAHISPRPQHPKQDPQAIEAFKKTFPSGWRRRSPARG